MAAAELKPALAALDLNGKCETLVATRRLLLTPYANPRVPPLTSRESGACSVSTCTMYVLTTPTLHFAVYDEKRERCVIQLYSP